MAYADIYNAATDAMFQGRCQVALWKAAQDIVAESANAADHQNRLAWATKVLQDRASISPKQAAMTVLQNASIAANPGASTDADIQFQVNSVILSLIVIG